VKRRWPIVAAYAAVALVQVGLLAGAYQLHVLSQTRMGVMRFLVAQNAALEASWFSPGAVLVQIGVFLVLVIACVPAAMALWRRERRFAAAQAVLAAVLSGAGAWLAVSFGAEDVYALYAALAAVWAALLVQVGVLAVSARVAFRSAEEDR